MHERSQRSIPTLGLTLVLLATGVSAQSSVQSNSPVVRMLLAAPDARTRAQAALTLARLRPPDARSALVTALADRAAVVRAAAASSLADLGDPAALSALRSRANDPDPNVRDAVARAVGRLDPSGGVAPTAPTPVDLDQSRIVVTAGHLVDHTHQNEHHLGALRDSVLRTLAEREGVAAPSGAVPASVRARVRRGVARWYSLDGGIQRLVVTELGGGSSVRAEVDLVIVSEPVHAIVGMVSGAATARGSTATQALRESLERTAIDGAVRGALQGIARNLEGARR